VLLKSYFVLFSMFKNNSLLVIQRLWHCS